MATVERIPKPSLPDVANGDIVYADDYNRDNEVIRAGVNANYADMQKIVQGKTFVLIAPNGDMNMLRLASNFILEFSLDGIKWFPTYATGPAGPPGPGIIPGGLAGQVLAKQSDVNFDTYWVDVLPTWGNIVGDIQDQTDLIALFNQVNSAISDIIRVTNKNVTVSGWSSVAPYTQTISFTGMTPAMTPLIYLEKVGTVDEKKKQVSEFSKISEVTSGDGTITLTCYGSKPTIDLVVAIKGV